MSSLGSSTRTGEKPSAVRASCRVAKLMPSKAGRVRVALPRLTVTSTVSPGAMGSPEKGLWLMMWPSSTVSLNSSVETFKVKSYSPFASFCSHSS